MPEAGEEDEFPRHSRIKISPRVRLAGQEREMLRERAHHAKCPRRQLLRRQPKIFGRCGRGKD